MNGLVGVERRQIVEMDLVAYALRVFEIDGVDFDEGKISLAVFRRANLAIDGVAIAQAKAADLVGRHIDVVGAGEVIRLRAAQKAEPVRQDFDDACAADLDAALGQLFQDREHHVLRAQGVRVLHLQLLSIGEEFSRRFALQLLEGELG